jgi:Ca2+-binding RTX toxin-like protein
MDGGADIDELNGGTGDDVYAAMSVNFQDVIVEAAGAGIDRVESYTSFSLAGIANVENLTLTGDGNPDGAGNTLDNVIIGTNSANVLTGDAGADTLTGGGGNDTLKGGEGEDTLSGEAGTDVMEGGGGSDIYVNPNFAEGDTIIEAANGGSDTVKSNATITLEGIAHLDHLILTGGGDINGTGNNLTNKITGTNGNNVLMGGKGNDVLAGSGGNDTLGGGQGLDTFRFAAANTGADQINGFEAAFDRFDLSNGTFSSRTEAGGNTLLTHAGGTILVKNIVGLSLNQ